MRKNACVVLVACAFSVILSNSLLSAEQYPARPITSIVPFEAGGSTDIVVRAMGSTISQFLGQPFVTSNKPGGGGTVGVYEVVKAKPDGYALVSCGATVVMPELYTQFRKDPPFTFKDVAPVAGWTANIIVIAVRKDAPWNTMKEFMEAAKNTELKTGSPGSPSLDYILQLALAKKYNAKLKNIPFKGNADSITALLGGHIDMATMIVGSAKPHVEAGTLKLLAVVFEERIALFPQVPTMAEQGYDVGISSFALGTFVRANTPVDRIKVLSEAIKKVANEKSFQSMMEKYGMPVIYSDTEKFRKNLDTKKASTALTFQDLGFLPK